ncbi:MAG: SGNH/GDSL hydrolase family protein [Eubacterium sp.]|nr:SGNH/GDSL hydrolase family protein [Eubacterium sp.]
MVSKEEIIRNGIMKGTAESDSTSRLRELYRKCKMGKEITIAFIGGSITAGCHAEPKETACFAARVVAWWKERFPTANINYINAGIGATDSWLGVHRVRREVMVYNPDLVFVEFSVNDEHPWNEETYDSLIKVLMGSESKPAVIPVMLAHKSGSFADKHLKSIKKYQLPAICYSNLLAGGFVDWDEVGSEDEVHPKTEGHELIAELITTFLNDEYINLLPQNPTESPVHDTTEDWAENLTEDRAENLTEDRAQNRAEDRDITPAKYSDSDIIYSDELEPYICDGFEAADVTEWLSRNRGWRTDSAGTISFRIKSREIGIIWLQKKFDREGYADYELIIDDEKCGLLKGSDPESWGDHLEYLAEFFDGEATEHTVILRPDSSGNKESSESGGCFEILGIAVTG